MLSSSTTLPKEPIHSPPLTPSSFSFASLTTVSSPLVCDMCNFLRGSVSGSVAKTVVYPMDRLKMIYQVRWSVVGAFSLCSICSGLADIARTEGILNLWKGNLASFIRIFPHSGLVFWYYDIYYDRLSTITSPALVRLFAGGLAGITSTLFTYPLDVWNTRMAVSQNAKKYAEVVLLRYDGMMGLYRGLLPTLLGMFPYSGISFFTFEGLKAAILRRRQCPSPYFSSSSLSSSYLSSSSSRSPEDALRPWESMVCGGLAGVVSQTATYPIDTVRKFMQANTFLYKYKEAGHVPAHGVSIRASVQHLYALSGFRVFYNGVSLNWLKGFLAAGISFTLNEFLKQAMANHTNCTMTGATSARTSSTSSGGNGSWRN